MSSTDEAIQLTNNDASFFKAYAVQKGYWPDPYIHYFTSSSALKGDHPLNEHKPPEMSRGYFARVNAIHTTVNKFLMNYKTSNQKCQIVNLGAGYDTLYLNLKDHQMQPFKYVEIDFPRVVSSKIRLIKSKKALLDKFQSETKVVDTTEITNGLFKLPTPTASFIAPRSDINEFKVDNYHLISVDLRKINDLDKKLQECNIDRNLPTLFISECVLVYMSIEHSSELLKYLTETFQKCCFLKYEQINLNDKFGEIMLHNMEIRSCKLLGVEACQSLESQHQSFITNGFSSCQVITLTDYYNNKMDKKERERIDSIEFLDETELLFQLLDHYCVCVAVNNPELSFIFLN